ncbi:hypothetical protein GDO81_014616 [Engystomops pustulosus]|uniref:NADH dehydrogenase subunit 6 n=1 Tax=Engystomops pustulosus TaxID=76066 RepID=A0AAV7BBJ9_ENGPU|nr:hypothetical protein GDO81_014616 [Engystomops pustulosus]
MGSWLQGALGSEYSFFITYLLGVYPGAIYLLGGMCCGYLFTSGHVLWSYLFTGGMCWGYLSTWRQVLGLPIYCEACGGCQDLE